MLGQDEFDRLASLELPRNEHAPSLHQAVIVDRVAGATEVEMGVATVRVAGTGK